ncbi:hypothetical protein HNQ07_003571 [Deinococcus metalli]|uniref:Uncharacterized protein n=1 Tax=Deinococcus metalli TaxID=1141878 RepID=A0A7W8KH83_9DEIO|nr:hypothetical protein [Deinococcus metalli]MBB5378070.1 hypothetical protein [Deinococcus metalli]GHF54197.1 hypothetical protein GCM10017781_33110 [Deinococcus metalli]
MRPRLLRAAIVREVALTWLDEPGHAFDARTFAQVHRVSALEVGRVLVDLRDAGQVFLRREDDTCAPHTVTLTREGQRMWMQEQAESCLPGIRQQLRAVYQVLQTADRPLSVAQLETEVPFTARRVRQVLLIMHSLGTMQATLGQDGAFADIHVPGSLGAIQTG